MSIGLSLIFNFLIFFFFTLAKFLTASLKFCFWNILKIHDSSHMTFDKIRIIFNTPKKFQKNIFSDVLNHFCADFSHGLKCHEQFHDSNLFQNKSFIRVIEIFHYYWCVSFGVDLYSFHILFILFKNLNPHHGFIPVSLF